MMSSWYGSLDDPDATERDDTIKRLPPGENKRENNNDACFIHFFFVLFSLESAAAEVSWRLRV